MFSCDDIPSIGNRNQATRFRGAKGNTALHIAVKLASVSLLKALLVFEADTAATNEDGLTPWQLAKKKWGESGVMDVMKDREGALFALHAVGAEGVHAEPGQLWNCVTLYHIPSDLYSLLIQLGLR